MTPAEGERIDQLAHGESVPGGPGPAPFTDDGAGPCECWSCDRQCGGTADPHSCGPVQACDGHLLCEACREAADVFDTDRQGARVRLLRGDGLVKLEAAVHDTFHKRTLRLTPTGARLLAVRLMEVANDAERAR